MTAQPPDVTEGSSARAGLDHGLRGGRRMRPLAPDWPDAPRYKGGVTRAATEWNGLCRGNLDRMVTDTRMLLIEGLKLATKTFAAAKLALGWVVGEMDEFVIHQVSRVHTDAFVRTFGIDPQKVLTIFHEHGNIGPPRCRSGCRARDLVRRRGPPHRPLGIVGPELLCPSRLVLRPGALARAGRFPTTRANQGLRAASGLRRAISRGPARREVIVCCTASSEFFTGGTWCSPARPLRASCPTTSAGLAIGPRLEDPPPAVAHR